MSGMNTVRQWMQTLLRDMATVPADAKYPAAWYAGLPVDPGEFSVQLAQLRSSLDHANSLTDRQPVSAP